MVLGNAVDQALLHLSRSFERGEIRFEKSLGGKERDHFGAKVDDIEVSAIGRSRTNAGEISCRAFQLNVRPAAHPEAQSRMDPCSWYRHL